MKISFNYIFLIFVVSSAYAQESHWLKKDSLYKYVQPVASFQFWSTYTMGEKAQLLPTAPLEPVQDRIGFAIRRARIGFRGNPYKKLRYVLSIQYDNLGKNKFSGIRGGVNEGDLGILDAYATWRITNNEMASLTVGYFHPQFSRECITGDMLVNSFDKSPSQTYIRQNIVGKNYGRSTGINLGGITSMNFINMEYNVGLFDNTISSTDPNGSVANKYWSPLVVERLTLSIGDPDKDDYFINYDINNYFNARKGITLGFNNSLQGRTGIFSSNKAMGVDVLLNYSQLNVDAEWVWMKRVYEGVTYRAETGHARIGYNILTGKKFFIEPTIMVMAFKGDNHQFSGKDQLYDIGVNWYLNKKNCKLSFHYVIQKGEGHNGFTDGITFEKGDFIGLGLMIII
jgi:hypothetical protein